MKKFIKNTIFFISFPLFAVSEPKFLGKNLISYDGFQDEKILQYFEIRKSEGVSVFLDKDIKLSKTGSICIFLEKDNSYSNVLSPFIPIEENKKYFFSVLFKQKWESKGYSYIGISSYPTIEWYDKDKKCISSTINRSSLSGFPYGECDWNLRDAILTSPENSKFARINITISNNSEKQTGKFIPSKLWIDNLQLKEYIPVEDVRPIKDEMLFFPAIDEGFSGKGSIWCKVIDDKDAYKKKAIYIPKVEKKGIVFHSPYFPSLPEGLYRFEIRAKVNDIKENINLGFVDIESEKSGAKLFIEFNTDLFKKEGQYFSFKEDFIIREPGWWCIRVYTAGKNDWYIDDIKITPLLKFSDNDIVEIYPGIEGFVKEDIYPRKEKPLKVLTFKGLLYEDWCGDDILKLIDENVGIKKIYFLSTMNTPKFDELPSSIEEIFDNNLIILNNINISAIPLMYKNYIKEYVKRGGNLIISSGHLGYKKDIWENSFLRDILPFEITDKIEFFRDGINLEKNEEFSFLKNIDRNLVVYYVQNIKNLKEDTKILINAKDYPFLVYRKYYQGNIFCFLGLNLGEKTNDGIPFWEWDGWKSLLKDLILSLK